MVKQLAGKSAEGPKEKNVSRANSLAHVPSSSTTMETRTLRQGPVPLAQALETIWQWLLVNLEPDEFSRETFLNSQSAKMPTKSTPGNSRLPGRRKQ
jgi:hypothetical protein